MFLQVEHQFQAGGAGLQFIHRNVKPGKVHCRPSRFLQDQGDLEETKVRKVPLLTCFRVPGERNTVISSGIPVREQPPDEHRPQDSSAGPAAKVRERKDRWKGPPATAACWKSSGRRVFRRVFEIGRRGSNQKPLLPAMPGENGCKSREQRGEGVMLSALPKSRTDAINAAGNTVRSRPTTPPADEDRGEFGTGTDVGKNEDWLAISALYCALRSPMSVLIRTPAPKASVGMLRSKMFSLAERRIRPR